MMIRDEDYITRLSKELRMKFEPLRFERLQRPWGQKWPREQLSTE